MRSASSPATPRPVRIMSIAWLWPMSRGRRTVPRSTSGTPQRRQKTPKTASVAATRRSHQSASSRPPATANPSTAAMTGLPSSMRDGPMGPSPSSLMSHSPCFPTAAPRRSWPAATAFRSAPAQNVPPAPVRTATASISSASKRRNASTIAPAVGSSTALRTSGRLMVTTAISPSVSNRTVLMRVLPLAGGCLPPLQQAPASREVRGWTRRSGRDYDPCAGGALMGLPNGIHHLAIATRDIKAQIEFFTQVVGMELVALYWMHGVPNTVHAFLRLGDSSSIAFVQGPEMAAIEPVAGVSHAGFTAGPVAPGVMQHVALNVSSEADLLALRDRLRSHHHWVMGPIDHGMCKSIYLAAPEGIMLEFATSAEAIDADEWIDPEVVGLCGIRADELERYLRPPAFASQRGAVPQPDPHARPNFEYPPGWRERGERFFRMSDEEIAAALSVPTPPVPKRRKAASA